MATKAVKRMTVEEFFDWSAKDDRRWELIRGVPVAMAPATQAHGRLVARLSRLVDETLDTKPNCWVIAGAGIRLHERSDSYYEADLAVSCTPVASGELDMVDPILIAEVLSPSTESKDRRQKLPDYRGLAAMREILLVHQDWLFCEIHRRLNDDRWLTDILRSPDARLRLESIGLDIPLSDLYAGVPLDDAEDG